MRASIRLKKKIVYCVGLRFDTVIKGNVGDSDWPEWFPVADSSRRTPRYPIVPVFRCNRRGVRVRKHGTKDFRCPTGLQALPDRWPCV